MADSPGDPMNDKNTTGIDSKPAGIVRVGTWNARMAVDSKSRLIEGLEADILIVPECAAEVAPLYRQSSFQWKGTNRSKGLGVFGFGGWKVEPIEDRSHFHLVPEESESETAGLCSHGPTPNDPSKDVGSDATSQVGHVAMY